MEPAQINHWEMEKNLSAFGDLDLIFKDTGGRRMLKNAPFSGRKMNKFW